MRQVNAVVFMLLVIASLACETNGQSVNVSKMALMTFTGTMEVKAGPAQVWAALTEADKFKSWYPGWKNATVAKPIAAVGQTVAFVDEWGNAGQSVVLYVEKNKELRVAHAPNDGSYVCQVKFKLEPKGATTLVTITDQYSDALDVPLDRDTAATVKAGMAQYMSGLKAAAEKATTAK